MNRMKNNLTEILFQIIEEQADTIMHQQDVMVRVATLIFDSLDKEEKGVGEDGQSG